MTAQMHLPRFFVKQKLAMMVNRYEVFAPAADGKGFGQLMAFAEQKRFAFKEQVTFFTDSTRTRPVFGFKARAVMDLNAGYDITDETGAPMGFFRKDFGASLLRSTFHLEGPGYAGTGQERNMAVALIRRFTDFDFLPIHFDYVGSDGAPLVSISGRRASATATPSTSPTRRVDFRVAAADGRRHGRPDVALTRWTAVLVVLGSSGRRPGVGPRLQRLRARAPGLPRRARPRLRRPRRRC